MNDSFSGSNPVFLSVGKAMLLKDMDLPKDMDLSKDTPALDESSLEVGGGVGKGALQCHPLCTPPPPRPLPSPSNGREGGQSWPLFCAGFQSTPCQGSILGLKLPSKPTRQLPKGPPLQGHLQHPSTDPG